MKFPDMFLKLIKKINIKKAAVPLYAAQTAAASVIIVLCAAGINIQALTIALAAAAAVTGGVILAGNRVYIDELETTLGQVSAENELNKINVVRIAQVAKGVNEDVVKAEESLAEILQEAENMNDSLSGIS